MSCINLSIPCGSYINITHRCNCWFFDQLLARHGRFTEFTNDMCHKIYP